MDPLSFQIFVLSCQACPSGCLFFRAGNVLPAVYSILPGMSFRHRECPSDCLFFRAGNVLPTVYSFVLICFTDLILCAALVVSAASLGLIEPFKIARYVIGDDAIIAVRISTHDNDINNYYRVNNRASTGGLLYEKWSCKEVARKGLRAGNLTDGRCVLFKMIVRQPKFSTEINCFSCLSAIRN